MTDLIQVQVGQCGNRIGSRVWEAFCSEHCISLAGNSIPTDDSGREYGRSVLFQETKEGQYSPRTVLVDTEPGTLDSIRAGPCGRLFSPDHYVYDTCGTANLFSRGYYEVGRDLNEETMERIRQLAEASDRLHGFQLTHSIGGGTGAGFASLLISSIREEYYDKLLCTHTVFPSPTASDSVLDTYNAVFALHHLIDSVDLTVMLDNDGLAHQARRAEHTVTYSAMNCVAASAINAFSSSMRFKGLHNASLRKLAMNLAVYPRPHFLSVAQSPVSVCGSDQSESEIVKSLFEFSNSMISVNADVQHPLVILLSAGLFRGDISSYEVEAQIASLAHQSAAQFSPWVPDRFSTFYTSVPALSHPRTAALLANSSIAYSVAKRLADDFTCLMRRKAFLHWYEGMKVEEFAEALSNVEDFALEYESVCYSEPVTWEELQG